MSLGDYHLYGTIKSYLSLSIYLWTSQESHADWRLHWCPEFESHLSGFLNSIPAT